MSHESDPVQVRDELTEVQMKTESGVLADVGKYVTEIYTALQGIQLPDDELNLDRLPGEGPPQGTREDRTASRGGVYGRSDVVPEYD